MDTLAVLFEGFMKKILFLFLIGVGMTIFFAAKNSIPVSMETDMPLRPSDAAAAPVVIDTYDSMRKPVQMTFERVPERVLVHQMNMLETILVLGQADKVVCVTMSSSSASHARLAEEYPEEYAKLPEVTGKELSREALIMSRPDFFLGWGSTFAPRQYGTTYWWNERGVKTYIAGNSNRFAKRVTVDEECKFIDDMGRIFHAREKSDAVIREIEDELRLDSAETQNRAPQNVMVVEITDRTIVNYDDRDLVGDMVRRLGGRIAIQSRRLSPEEVIAADPDVIFVTYFGAADRPRAEQFFRNIRFNSLKAVKNDRIYLLPFSHMYTSAIKTVDGLRTIKKGLYPDL